MSSGFEQECVDALPAALCLCHASFYIDWHVPVSTFPFVQSVLSHLAWVSISVFFAINRLIGFSDILGLLHSLFGEALDRNTQKMTVLVKMKCSWPDSDHFWPHIVAVHLFCKVPQSVNVGDVNRNVTGVNTALDVPSAGHVSTSIVWQCCSCICCVDDCWWSTFLIGFAVHQGWPQGLVSETLCMLSHISPHDIQTVSTCIWAWARWLLKNDLQQ